VNHQQWISRIQQGGDPSKLAHEIMAEEELARKYERELIARIFNDNWKKFQRSMQEITNDIKEPKP
jgi:hypothetical protein